MWSNSTSPLNMYQKMSLIVVLLTCTLSYTSHALRHISGTSLSASDAVITAACKNALYPEACESSLSSLVGASDKTKTPKELFDLSVQLAVGRAHSALSSAYNLTLSGRNHKKKQTGLDDCLELLDLSVSQLNDVLDASKNPTHDDVHTWLSAAMTNQDTCVDGLQSMSHSPVRGSVEAQAQSLAQYISNSLALHVSINGGQSEDHRTDKNGGFPGWVMERERRLLEASAAEIKADAVVAKDGSGTHRTIGEAIASLAGGGRSTVYVKAGTYKEILKFTKKQANVMLYGDGAGKTVIVGDRSAESGWTTYASATVSAMGPGFIAKDLTIVNSAGPSEHQAVALRIGADRSVIYRCSIQGYQDTLYTHSNRQFYRDNDIYGTFSRTVIMGSYIDDLIQPAGWTPWAGDFALKTLYYAEYGNTGPGAGTAGRVGWPGVHRALSTADASKFTVAQFIFGNAWLPGTGVDFDAGL
ncbi:putative pectinesterase/pectinesterase inhibitor 35 [Acorus calamus]|uniref:Pectinesterase/pectinesterase inhibitor 35 n=1 Tax=Acorus calamus TaxID=4465 RepID=A0AAV9ENF4_ACOCL|nr:putative pectinesterase/pectinesterase inhibitor 35 [Acorus calamus]